MQLTFLTNGIQTLKKKKKKKKKKKEKPVDGKEDYVEK